VQFTGGLTAVQANNEEKAKLLYDAIQASNGFYNNPVDPSCRSLMNVPFTIPSNPDLEKVSLFFFAVTCQVVTD
jgi:phosphoserine aminotransferase